MCLKVKVLIETKLSLYPRFLNDILSDALLDHGTYWNAHKLSKLVPRDLFSCYSFPSARSKAFITWLNVRWLDALSGIESVLLTGLLSSLTCSILIAAYGLFRMSLAVLASFKALCRLLPNSEFWEALTSAGAISLSGFDLSSLTFYMSPFWLFHLETSSSLKLSSALIMSSNDLGCLTSCSSGVLCALSSSRGSRVLSNESLPVSPFMVASNSCKEEGMATRALSFLMRGSETD